MCWTRRIGSGKFAGRAPRTLASAGGPPVEAAIPMTLGRVAFHSASRLGAGDMVFSRHGAKER